MPDPDVRDSDPNAGGREGLGGGMGVSSERVPNDETSIEGTGSKGTAKDTANGVGPTFDAEHETQEWREDQPAANVEPVPTGDPEISSGTDWEGIDRTVGEDNPAKVPPHPFDRDRNPGHSQG